MQKYVFYDNYGTIVHITDTKREIRQKWEDSKVARILVKSLDKLGYKKESIVTKTGEFGIRGYVIDVYPLGEDNVFPTHLLNQTRYSVPLA